MRPSLRNQSPIHLALGISTELLEKHTLPAEGRDGPGSGSAPAAAGSKSRAMHTHTLFLGLGRYWWTKKTVKTVLSVKNSLASPPPHPHLVQFLWHAAGCCVHCNLGSQVFGFKACLLMQEDIGNKLIALLSNDPCTNIQSLIELFLIWGERFLKFKFKMSFCYHHETELY